ncbi:LysR family transcriptional regulator [Novosphingobium malaysiense]|uniref:LysR family transcriptional regulator n=1 Tax=Novosphingobium malaysiense TaxID=1348853 RepID=UPI00068D04F5|nr:LysR family transcriptional regulator [Novosphingobium malaysiense]
MDFRLLRYYIAVIEEGSIQSAARRMNVAQPAMSRRIRDLELSLDCRLLERGVRGVTPTRAGQAFYLNAIALVKHLEGAILDAQRLDLEHSNDVRIGLVHSARRYAFLQRATARYRERPGLPRLSLQRGYSAELAELLRDNRLEMSLLFEHRSGSPRLRDRLIHRERYVLAAHPAHPLAQEVPLDLAALAKFPLTWLARQFEGGEQDILLQLCRRHGLEPLIERRVATHEEQIDLTIVSGGICLTPASTMLSTPRGQFVFRPIPDFPMTLELSLGWQQEFENPAAAALLEELCTAIDEHQGSLKTPDNPVILCGIPLLES